MENKRYSAFSFNTPIKRDKNSLLSNDTLRSVVTTRSNNEGTDNKGRWSVGSFGSMGYRRPDEFSFGTNLVQKPDNILIHHSKERKLIMLSNSVQSIPKSRYASLGSSNDKLAGIEKNSGKDDFQIKEYMIDSMPIQEDEHDNDILILQEKFDEDNIQKNNKDQSMFPNIPFSLCISYLKQERSQICNKLQSVWKGYKTRSILRGSLRGFTFLKTSHSNGFIYNSGKIYLGYNIHKILLSIIDLYDLILDEESKVFQGSSTKNNSTSWLDAMYEQVYDFKTKYILEVNNALNGNNGKKWVLDILNARETSKKDISKKLIERKGILPKRFETKYNKMIHYNGLFYNSNKIMDRNGDLVDQNFSQRRVGGKSLENDRDLDNGNKILESSIDTIFDSIYIPYLLVKSNSLEKVSTYLGIKTDKILDIIQNESDSKDVNNSKNNIIAKAIGFDLTPGIGRRTGELVREQSPFLDKITPNAFREGGSNSNIYFTPNSLIHGSCKEGNDCVEYYTPVQEEFRDSIIDQNEYASVECNTENQRETYRVINQIKPKPYLKRKSKSIVPSKGTDIELDKVTSKVKELYKGKNLNEKKVLKKVPVSGAYELSGSRIPSISSTLNIVSDSPSRNSSSKVSRIPKYTE
ncbi:hypothetical protein CmeUKMEL1_10810 [Cryptosporidium meleagridis]|uniref:Uncharacterized protein n=1 Tax=Cryptosporidium meleagridis TaxID=93969 RepID=A0A2P4Z279_9CRYT|nr:hypothetical protein CmeUKMEL1_10810 [Cryptosporidium meleagridis]